MIDVWIPNAPERRHIGPVPDRVRLHVLPRRGPLLDEIHGAEFLVPPVAHDSLTGCLAQMPSLRVVQAVSSGVEELIPWIPAGVTLCNARGIYDIPVAEWVIAAILALGKEFLNFTRRQAEHVWAPTFPHEVAGQHALVVGPGSIGRAVTDRLTSLGVNVVLVGATARENVRAVADLPDLLPGADIVVLTLPLTLRTRGLFDEQMLSRMRVGAMLVNASRGPVVDTDALIEQLTMGRIRAALDVTDPEPLPRDHPLWDIPNVLITPHVGSSPEAEKRLYRLVGDQIRRHVRGEALVNVVKGDS